MRTRSGEYKNCLSCDIVIYVSPYQLKTGGRKYCSWACRILASKQRVPWNKGVHIDLGGPKFKKGHIPWSKGKKLGKQSQETIDKRTAKNRGQKRSGEQKKKFREIAVQKWSGEKHWNWKGGITRENEKIRHCVEYKDWRTAVFERDDYTCKECAIRGDYLEADHVKPFALFPELRFDINNGRTLCRDCHRKVGFRNLERDGWGRFASILIV